MTSRRNRPDEPDSTIPHFQNKTKNNRQKKKPIRFDDGNSSRKEIDSESSKSIGSKSIAPPSPTCRSSPKVVEPSDGLAIRRFSFRIDRRNQRRRFQQEKFYLKKKVETKKNGRRSLSAHHRIKIGLDICCCCCCCCCWKKILDKKNRSRKPVEPLIESTIRADKPPKKKEFQWRLPELAYQRVLKAEKKKEGTAARNVP